MWSRPQVDLDLPDPTGPVPGPKTEQKKKSPGAKSKMQKKNIYIWPRAKTIIGKSDQIRGMRGVCAGGVPEGMRGAPCLVVRGRGKDMRRILATFPGFGVLWFWPVAILYI